MKRVLLSAFVAVMALSSCQKSTPRDSAGPGIKPNPVAYKIQDDAHNPNNPFDMVGYQHNYALETTRSVWSAPGALPEDAYNAISSYAASIGETMSPMPVCLANNQAYIADYPNRFANFIASTALSPQGKLYATQLMGLYIDVDVDGSYMDYKNNVMNLEATILADASLDPVSRERLLKGASIARYSLLYWQNYVSGVYDDPSNPVPPVTAGKNIFQKLRDWWNRNEEKICRGAIDVCAVLNGQTGSEASSTSANYPNIP